MASEQPGFALIPFLAAFFLTAGLVSAESAAATGDSPPEWIEAEKGILENHVQLTSEEQFLKAGESYFSPDGKKIIFQAVERVPEGEQEENFYQMYVADLVFEASRVVGLGKVLRLSPPGSANTCGWFHPTEPGVVIFGSTVVPPSDPGKTGYQRGSSRYVWQFPQEMDIVSCELASADGTAASLKKVISDPDAYLAECAISGDGRNIVYCEHQVAEGSNGGDLFIMDLETRRRVSVAGGSGYDGGPFFSPDGQRICYRSDRRGDDLLQVFVSEFATDSSGNILGVAREFQLTDNFHVNWAPFWHPGGRFLIYTTSEMGHDNYEVFVIDADAGTDGGPTRYGTRRRRVTTAARFDGLPVFNASASHMMWTCQRSADHSSQVWIADFVMALDGAATEEQPATASDARPEKLQVEDPETGLIYMYDPASHELSIYNPRTHQVRTAESKEEIDKAMKLFKR